MSKPFHVVHIKFHGEHRNYHVYRNNKPFVAPAEPLKKQDAYAICHLLNHLGIAAND